MIVSIIKEIQTARHCQSSLTTIDRRMVVAHIQSSLDRYAGEIANLGGEHSEGFGTLMDAVIGKAPEIVSADNGKFLVVMVGFEKLFHTLERMFGPRPPSAHSIN